MQGGIHSKWMQVGVASLQGTLHGTKRLLQANGKGGLAIFSLRPAAKSFSCCCPLMLFIAQWLQIRGIGWTLRAKRNPKEICGLYNSFSRFCSILCWWKSQIQDHRFKKFTEPFKLNSQNSVGCGIVRKPQWEIPVSKQPYKLFSVKF